VEDKLIPNREALHLLRRRGKVVWSRQATRAFLAAAVLSYLVIFGEHYAEEVWRVVQMVLAAQPTDPGLLGSVATGMAVAIVTTSLIALSVGILASLVQTGLFFSIRLILPIFRRREARRVVFPMCISPILGFTVGGWLFYRYFRDIVLVLRQPSEKVLSSIGLVMSEIGKTLIVVALVFAILALLGARISFLWRHRMTRRELTEQSHK
jgi:flagellar biosynthesis protein FlhB